MPRASNMIDIQHSNGDVRGAITLNLCRVQARESWISEAEANARLIASAPELLAALEAALLVIEDYLEYGHNGDPWTEDARTMGEMDINDYKHDGRLESARAVIAKATGVA